MEIFGGKVNNNIFSIHNPIKLDQTPSFSTISTKLKKPPKKSMKNWPCFTGKYQLLDSNNKQAYKIKSRPTSILFERIHSDLIGRINPQSRNKTKFILTFFNNVFRYITGFPLFEKYSTPEVLINLLEGKKKWLGYLPNMICSDGGGEFSGNRLVNYMDANHIQRLISEPYHPEHNGRTERTNQTIIKSIRALFWYSGLSKALWHEFLKTCWLSLNQIPRGEETKSPWERVHGFSLQVNYLKPRETQEI
ncbi:hypothetical protein VP01_4508g2 [Puccinia sorghi]|uniref:Integrase catalytic domain-containing protein n=1 Tax=Puccinia sorghi TaxID=27349 RepID=A0A0L6UP19_9BASI|nr:hypothetical protein VP01_4508g2 [Puccinia sorghi]